MVMIMEQFPRYCEGCMWEAECGQESGCSDYTPLDDLDDNDVLALISEQRASFEREWRRYLEYARGA